MGLSRERAEAVADCLVKSFKEDLDLFLIRSDSAGSIRAHQVI